MSTDTLWRGNRKVSWVLIAIWVFFDALAIVFHHFVSLQILPAFGSIPDFLGAIAISGWLFAGNVAGFVGLLLLLISWVAHNELENC